MRNLEHPGSGFVVKLSSLTAILPADDKKEIERLRDDFEVCELCELLGKVIPADMAKPAEVFVFSDEDLSEDLLRRMP